MTSIHEEPPLSFGEKITPVSQETLLDRFAASAVSGMIAAEFAKHGEEFLERTDQIAMGAYMIATAMMQERRYHHLPNESEQ